jgi:hypothetical protein
MKTPRLGTYFHIALDFGHRAKKKFFPGGHTTSIKDFQTTLQQQKSKIGTSFLLIKRHDLASKIYLGPSLLFAEEKLASSLYKHAIDPRFFAEALHVIVLNAAKLKPDLARVQLKNLRRDNIARAIAEKKIHPLEIGTHFHVFSKQTTEQRLKTLQKLDVIVFEDKKPKPKDPKPAKTAPPIIREKKPQPPIAKEPEPVNVVRPILRKKRPPTTD